MHNELLKIDERPKPFEIYTAKELWDDDHISQQMLHFHLNGDVDPASRKTDTIEKSLEWIISEFKVGPGVNVADFGCGPGLYSLPLASTGADVTGIDFSRRSVAHARRAAKKADLDIEYVVGNYLNYASDKRFDLITLIYCDLCPLSPAQRKQLMGIFHKQLADGGRVLFDVLSMKAFEGREESATFGRNFMGGFWSPSDYMGFMRTFVYGQERVVLDKYTIVEPDRTRAIYNWLQYFTLEDICGELEASGFAVEAHYANVCGDVFTEESTEIALVGRKR